MDRTNDDRDLLIRRLAGDLPPEDERALDLRLASDDQLRTEWERLQRLGADLRERRVTSFGPGFADRVMARVPSGAVVVLDTALRRQFRQLLPTAAAALLALLAHNVFVADTPADQSVVEAALGLEPVSVDAIYTLESTLYAGGSQP